MELYFENSLSLCALQTLICLHSAQSVASSLTHETNNCKVSRCIVAIGHVTIRPYVGRTFWGCKFHAHVISPRITVFVRVARYHQRNYDWAISDFLGIKACMWLDFFVTGSTTWHNGLPCRTSMIDLEWQIYGFWTGSCICHCLFRNHKWFGNWKPLCYWSVAILTFDVICLQGVEWKGCILWGGSRSRCVGCKVGSSEGDKGRGWSEDIWYRVKASILCIQD